jgi:hypothetical protein
MNRPLESDYTSQVAYTRALEAYCDALAQPDHIVDANNMVQPAQEPVAWQWLGSAHFRKKLPKNADITAWNPLYTNPPQRTWVGLTDEEIQELRYKIDSTAHWTYDEFARAIEAKLKEKNFD